MIKVLSFLSNENCFAGHSRGPCEPHVARGPRFENHCFKGFIKRTFSCRFYQLYVNELINRSTQQKHSSAVETRGLWKRGPSKFG